MSEAISIEIGASLDPKLLSAFKTLDSRIASLDKGLSAVLKNLTSFEKLTTVAAASTTSLNKSLATLGRTLGVSLKRTDALYAARNREMATTRRAIGLAEQESIAQRKVAASIAARERALQSANRTASREAIRNSGRVGNGVATGGNNSGGSGLGGYLANRGNSASFPIGSAAIGSGIAGSVLQSSGFDYRNQLIANTGNLSDKDRDNMARQIKEMSGRERTNQTTKELQSALEVYVSAGLNPLREGLGALEDSGKAATAYGIQIQDIATTNAAAMSNLAIKPEQIGNFLDVLAAAGKVGQYEAKDFAASFGGMSANMKEFGVQGVEGAKYLASLMQAIRVGAPDSATAYTNFENLRGHIDSPEVSKAYEEKLGFDLPGYLQEVRAQGGNVIKSFIDKTRELTQGKIENVSRIATDTQFRNGLMAAMNNMDKFDAAFKAATNSAGEFNRDFERTLRTTQEQLKTATISVLNLATEVGTTLAPAIKDIVADIRPFVNSVSQFIAQNPQAVSTTIKYVAAITALNLAVGPAVKLFQTGQLALSGFSNALRYMTGIAPAAGQAAGTALGTGINSGVSSKVGGFFAAGGPFATLLGGAALVSIGYGVGSLIGEGIANGMKEKSNAALDGGAGLLKGSKFDNLANELSNTRSANPEDRNAAYKKLVDNPYVKDEIRKSIADIEAKKPLMLQQQATQQGYVDKYNAATADKSWLAPRSLDAKIYENAPSQLDQVKGAISRMDSEKAALESKLGIIDYATKFKAGDQDALKQAADANARLIDDQKRLEAKQPSAMTSSEKKQLQAIRDVSITITGVPLDNAEALATAIKAKLDEKNTEQQADSDHAARTGQDNATSPY